MEQNLQKANENRKCIWQIAKDSESIYKQKQYKAVNWQKNCDWR